MHYRPLAKQTRNRRKDILVICGAIVVFGVSLIDKDFFAMPIRNGSLLVSQQVEMLVSIPFNLVEQFQTKSDLISENRQLNDSFSSLSAYCKAEVESLVLERDELEKVLNRRGAHVVSASAKSAFVIGKPPVSPYGSIIIDLGLENGIKEGDLAILGKYIIGKIESVYANRASVRLFGERGDKKTLLVGEKRIVLLGEGAGFGSYEAEYINLNDSIDWQTVRLQDFPEYIFGSVHKRDESSAEKFEIVVSSPINVFELSSVEIVSNEN